VANVFLLIFKLCTGLYSAYTDVTSCLNIPRDSTIFMGLSVCCSSQMTLSVSVEPHALLFLTRTLCSCILFLCWVFVMFSVSFVFFCFLLHHVFKSPEAGFHYLQLPFFGDLPSVPPNFSILSVSLNFVSCSRQHILM
jgi:hypothetical protein